MHENGHPYHFQVTTLTKGYQVGRADITLANTLSTCETKEHHIITMNTGTAVKNEISINLRIVGH